MSKCGCNNRFNTKESISTSKQWLSSYFNLVKKKESCRTLAEFSYKCTYILYIAWAVINRLVPFSKPSSQLTVIWAPFHYGQKYIFFYCSHYVHLISFLPSTGNNSTKKADPRGPRKPAKRSEPSRGNFNQRLLYKNQARALKKVWVKMAACRVLRWTFFAPIGKKCFSVLLFGIGSRSVYESVPNFPIVLTFIERLREFDFKNRTAFCWVSRILKTFVYLGHEMYIRSFWCALNAPLATRLYNFCILSLARRKRQWNLNWRKLKFNFICAEQALHVHISQLM